VGRSKGRRPLEGLDVDGRMILKRSFKQWDKESWTGLIHPRIGTGGGLL
jgi:hypothetical protein